MQHALWRHWLLPPKFRRVAGRLAQDSPSVAPKVALSKPLSSGARRSPEGGNCIARNAISGLVRLETHNSFRRRTPAHSARCACRGRGNHSVPRRDRRVVAGEPAVRSAGPVAHLCAREGPARDVAAVGTSRRQRPARHRGGPEGARLPRRARRHQGPHQRGARARRVPDQDRAQVHDLRLPCFLRR